MKYLIADPSSGTVVRRSSKPARGREFHLCSLPVRKAVWKSYRAGDLVQIQDLNPGALEYWLRAVRSRQT